MINIMRLCESKSNKLVFLLPTVRDLFFLQESCSFVCPAETPALGMRADDIYNQSLLGKRRCCEHSLNPTASGAVDYWNDGGEWSGFYVFLFQNAVI